MSHRILPIRATQRPATIPALVENGLFRHLHATFPTLIGYYTTLHVILLLAYMALCRIRTVEQLQYESPGELGKLLGLDRVPEVRCLRNKLRQLSDGQNEQAAESTYPGTEFRLRYSLGEPETGVTSNSATDQDF